MTLAEDVDVLIDRVRDLTRRGWSAKRIAPEIGRTERTVVRYRVRGRKRYGATYCPPSLIGGWQITETKRRARS